MSIEIPVILGIITLLSSAFWMRSFIRIIVIKKKNNFPLRGLIKFLSMSENVAPDIKIIQEFVWTTSIFSFIPCLWMAWYVWATDYSFLIGLFPLVWYYFLFRYLLWEKSDLSEKPTDRQKKNFFQFIKKKDGNR